LGAYGFLGSFVRPLFLFQERMGIRKLNKSELSPSLFFRPQPVFLRGPFLTLLSPRHREGGKKRSSAL